MGYAGTRPFTVHNIYSPFASGSLTTVPNTSNVNITVPDFIYPINYAYVDLIILHWGDTSGALNYPDGGTFGISSGGHQSGGALSNVITCEANGDHFSYYYIPGTNDLSAYVFPGTVQALQLHDATAHADNFTLNKYFFNLRLFFSN